MGRDLKNLHPFVHRKVKEFLVKVQEGGLHALIYDAFRSFTEQQAIYDIGRKSPGKVVTNAKPGESYHNYGLAVDFVPMDDQPGRVLWDDLKLFQAIGEMAEDLGFEWGGRWPMKDRPHLQMSFGYKWQYLFEFYVEGGLPAVWSKIDLKISEGWPFR